MIPSLTTSFSRVPPAFKPLVSGRFGGGQLVENFGTKREDPRNGRPGEIRPSLQIRPFELLAGQSGHSPASGPIVCVIGAFKIRS